MIKLNYNATVEITSHDMKDMSEPKLIYVVWRNRPMGWTDAVSKFLDDAENIDLALDVVALTVVTVSDGGKPQPVRTADKARELMDAIEAGNPGYGQAYIFRLANNLIDVQLAREEVFVEQLEKNLPASDAGHKIASSNGQTKQRTPSKATS